MAPKASKRPYSVGYQDQNGYRTPSSDAFEPSRFASQERAPKAARTSYSAGQSYAVAGSSQQDPLIIDDPDDDEDDASQEVQDASQGYNEVEMSWVLYGVIETKIVGVRFYNGHATTGELAKLNREPNNQYDRNAIQVLNVNNTQIGHIPKAQAAKLAPYLDSRSLVVEATISGPKDYYECPLLLRVYGTAEPAAREALIQRMRNDKLPITSFREAQNRAKEESKRRKLAVDAAKKAKKNGATVVAVAAGQPFENGLSDYAGGPMQGAGHAGLSLEDIIGGSERFNPRNADQMVEEFGLKEEDLAAMPKASQPTALLTQLHDFQLQGLHWMLEKESPQLPAQGTKDVVQLWQRHSTIRDAFTNVATHFSITTPELASGGILADDMGLGKTIQVISLIMADRELGRKAPDACNASLILAPVSVMSNWSTQIRKHVKEEYGLRIMFYHGNRKQPITAKTIEKYDVVISTYDKVSTEWHSQKSTKLPRANGVFSVKWRRVILDEGHSIRNPKAKKTVAVSSLMAQSRWALTGTPIINNLKDLFSLVRFLRLSGGLDSLEIFNGAIMRPVLQGDANGNKALQLLMAGLCLRRKKEMSFIDLRLPELTEYIHKVTLLPHEQEKYDAFEAQAKGTLDLYRNKGGREASDTYRHLLEVLLRMRQLCNHWKMISEERISSIMQQLSDEGVVDLTPENKEALQKMLQLSIESQEDCPICLDAYKDPVITVCAHSFCASCIERVIETQHKCPMCRAPLDSLATTTVKPAVESPASSMLPPTQEELLDKASLENETSSKVTALLSILTASARDPSNKTIIFSQWTSFLSLLEPHLRAAGITYTRIDGSMTAPLRDAALETFDTAPECTVLLASLAVCSVGLNLVAANQVVLADSWWAPAIEDQAVDRVHRLGQTRETKVFRLVVRGSVEERVLGIQEEKRRLMGLAFAEKEGAGGGKRRGRAAGVADLERLLGGAGAGAANGGGDADAGAEEVVPGMQDLENFLGGRAVPL